MSHYESPRELRRRVREARKKAETEDLRTQIPRVNLAKELAKEILIELPDTLAIGVPRAVKSELDADRYRQRESGGQDAPKR